MLSAARAGLYTSLDAFRLALEALIRGEAIARVSSDLRGAARSGAERRARLGSARAEAGEATAALIASRALSLGERAEVEAVTLVDRRLTWSRKFRELRPTARREFSFSMNRYRLRRQRQKRSPRFDLD